MNFERFLEDKISGSGMDVKGVLEELGKTNLDEALKRTNILIGQTQEETYQFLLRMLKAYILIGQHQYEESIFMLKELLKIEPENHYCYYFYGLCLRNLNFPWEALKYFEKARSIKEDDKISEQINNTKGIIKVAENKALQIVAFKEVPERLRFLG